MISPFSRMMVYAVDTHFMKDRSGRLVFVPFGLKRKCYFVDSKSGEEKIRAFVKMYRSVNQLIAFLTYPSIFVPGLILEDYAGLTPRGHRLAICSGDPFVFLAGPDLVAMDALGLIQRSDSELDLLTERGRT